KSLIEVPLRHRRPSRDRHVVRPQVVVQWRPIHRRAVGRGQAVLVLLANECSGSSDRRDYHKPCPAHGRSPWRVPEAKTMLVCARGHGDRMRTRVALSEAKGARPESCPLRFAQGDSRVRQSVRLSSTLRFCALPDAVLLLATGWSHAYPCATIRLASTPCSIRNAITASARALERLSLRARGPVLSVWPATSIVTSGLATSDAATSPRMSRDWGSRTALLISKFTPRRITRVFFAAVIARRLSRSATRARLSLSAA